MTRARYFGGELRLSEGTRGYWEVEALRVGHWDYPPMGPDGFDCTPELLAQLKANFDAGYYGFEVPVDGPSRGGEAHSDNDLHDCGWVKALELRDSGQSLWAILDITEPNVLKMVQEKSLKYVSSELDTAWYDPKNKQTLSVFTGLSLTNRPYLKGMQPLTLVNFSEAAATILSEILAGNQPEPTGAGGAPTTPTEDTDVKDKTAPGTAQLEPGQDIPANPQATEAQLKEIQGQIESQRKESIRLAEQHAALRKEIALENFKAKLQRIARKKGLPVPVIEKSLAFGERLIEKATTVGQFGTKAKHAEGEDDQLSVTDELLDMLEEMPDTIAADKANLSDDEDEDDAEDAEGRLSEGEEEDDHKATQAVMKERGLTYGAAYRIVLTEKAARKAAQRGKR